jgi:F0F1-type ATP synthase assembly protein I
MAAVVVGLALGAGLGQLAGALVRSDNMPFFVALGALVGMCVGLVGVLTARMGRQHK